MKINVSCYDFEKMDELWQTWMNGDTCSNWIPILMHFRSESEQSRTVHNPHASVCGFLSCWMVLLASIAATIGCSLRLPTPLQGCFCGCTFTKIKQKNIPQRLKDQKCLPAETPNSMNQEDFLGIGFQIYHYFRAPSVWNAKLHCK